MGRKSDIEELNPKQRESLIIDLKLAFRSRFRNQEEIANLADSPSQYPRNKFYKHLIEDCELILKVNTPFSPNFLINIFHSPKKRNYEKKKLDVLREYISKVTELEHFPALPLERKLDESLRSEIGKYKIHLIQKYKKIRLGIINFEMPIEFIIPLQLKYPPKEIREEIVALEYKKSTLKGGELTNEISEKIEKLQMLLESQYDVVKIIKEEKNIYIQASAGMGKTTFLKWITYSLARNSFGLNYTLIPIFLELKFYVNSLNDNSLLDLINRSLKGFTNFEELRKSGVHILVCIDGFDEFDEFGGDVQKLLKQIYWISEGNKIQIFFSGRIKPEYENLLKMNLFTLRELTMEDVEEILMNVFKNKGKNYFSKLKRVWKKELYNPLQLTLLMALIKDKKELDSTLIESVLKNKGVLYKTLVVDSFIKKYEWKRIPRLGKGSDQKASEIEVISYLAYLMTYIENDNQTLKRYLAEEALQRYIQLHKRLGRVQSEKLIDAFVGHNILEESDGLISFEPKEFRMFFTALYLSKVVHNRSNFLKMKSKFVETTNKTIMMGAHIKVTTKKSNTWISLEQFLMGLIDPDHIIDEALEVQYSGRFVLSHELLVQVEDCIKLLQQSNIPNKGSFRTKKSLADFLSNTLLQYNKSNINKKPSLINKLHLNSVIRKSLSKKLIPEKWIKPHLIEQINYSFIQNSFYNKDNYIKYLSEILLENELAIPYMDFQDMLMEMEDSYEKSIFTHTLITSDKYGINELFGISDVLELLYRHITSQPHPFREEHRFGEFIRKYTKRHPRELLTYFAMRYKEPKVFGIYRLIEHFNSYAKRGEVVRLDTEIWGFYKTIFVKWIAGMKRERHFILFSEFLKRLGGSHRDEILDFYIQQLKVKSLSLLERERYCIFMIWNVRKKDIKVLQDIINYNDRIAREAIAGLMYYISRQNPEDEESTTVILKYFEGIITAPGNDNLKFSILFNACHWRIRTTSTFEDCVFTMLKNDRSNFIPGLLFLGLFQVRQAEGFLVGLLEQEDPVYMHLAFYCLFLLEHSNHFKYFHLVEHRYQKLKVTHLSYNESGHIIMDSQIYYDSLYMGDQQIWEFYKKIENHQIIRQDRFVYEENKSKLEWKIRILDEVLKKKSTPL